MRRGQVVDFVLLVQYLFGRFKFSKMNNCRRTPSISLPTLAPLLRLHSSGCDDLVKPPAAIRVGAQGGTGGDCRSQGTGSQATRGQPCRSRGIKDAQSVCRCGCVCGRDSRQRCQSQAHSWLAQAARGGCEKGSIFQMTHPKTTSLAYSQFAIESRWLVRWLWCLPLTRLPARHRYGEEGGLLVLWCLSVQCGTHIANNHTHLHYSSQDDPQGSTNSQMSPEAQSLIDRLTQVGWLTVST